MKKRFLQGVMTLGMAAAICLGASAVQANAATVMDENVGSIYIDDANRTMTVESSADKEILFGISTVKNGIVKTSSWETYETNADGYVEIDLSSLKTTKDNYVQVKGTASTDPVTIKIPKSDALKAKIDKATRVVTLSPKGKATVTFKKGDLYEYKTASATEWNEIALDSDDGKLVALPEMYQMRGATIYIRKEVSYEGASLTKDAASTLKESDGETAATVYNASQFPSEVKVSTGKKANAPKITADYTKNTVKIPKGCEFRINTADGLIKDWDKSAQSAAYTLSADTKIKIVKEDETGEAKETEVTWSEFLAYGGVVEVKKVAANKPESKIGSLPCGTISTTATSYQNDEASVDKQTAGDDNKVVASYALGTDKKKTPTLKITNGTGDKYEVIVSATEPKVGDKAKAIAKNKTVTIKNPTEGQYVWIHKVGDKSKSAWSTGYVKLGKIVKLESSSDDNTQTSATDAEKLAAAASEYFETSIAVPNASAAGDAITITKSGKSISDFSNATLETSKGTIEGVTITIQLSDTVSSALATDATKGLVYGTTGTMFETLCTSPVTATVTLTKGSDTETATITISKP